MSFVKPQSIKASSIPPEDELFSLSPSTFDGSSSSDLDSTRDEVQEVRNRAHMEERNVRLWRWTLFLVLVAVGVTVSYLTYYFLQEEEVKAFETAFEQFSKALEDSAINHQQDLRDAYRGFESTISNWVASSNSSWPLVNIPRFESYARHLLKMSGTEVVSLFPAVSRANREAWLQFTEKTYESMVKEAHLLETGGVQDLTEVGYHPYISAPSPKGFVEDRDRDVYFPSWHYSPPPFTYGLINWNVQSVPDYDALIKAMHKLKNETLVTRVRKYVGVGTALSQEEHDRMHSKLKDSSSEHPHSFVFHPIHLDTEDYNSPIVAVAASGIAWDFSLLNLLPEGVVGMHAVIKNNCNQSYTYEINGPEAFFLGEGDLHELEYDDYERLVNLAPHTNPDFVETEGHCQFSMQLYPADDFADLYFTNVPLTYSCSVGGTFLLVIFIFYIYNWFLHKRNEKLVVNAARSNAVITSLFPENIRDQIIGSGDSSNNPRSFEEVIGASLDPTADLSRKPLADYFAIATVMFADIVGFTAWSSVREPSQVFMLLETLYGSFDRLTKKAKVFKVETVGDCYVAATGIPKYHLDHAVCMVQFAHQISKEMRRITRSLESKLGPDTGDLLLRIGIHTGPVTAGVIRGDKARFQLFGDTMNVASRIESSGKAGRIHVSQDTAECLQQCGKGNWLVKREEGAIMAKGKGDVQTYWIGKALIGKTLDQSSSPDSTFRTEGLSESSERGSDFSDPIAETLSDADGRQDRLVEWNVTIFSDLIRQIVARRMAREIATSRDCLSDTVEVDTMSSAFKPIEEVREIIALPEFDERVSLVQINPDTIEIPKQVEDQLRQYVTTIASMYQQNPFHNFEHASHVAMSVIKMLSRIIAPTDIGMEDSQTHIMQANLHDHTYGITSDPLTQFACAFSALIHDVDHEGVPNSQLVKEERPIAAMYGGRSVAEQNSLVLSWNLFMDERFKDLRSTICGTSSELRRFRDLVVNSVMATDIVDKDLKKLRNGRWDKAFKESCYDISSDDVRDAVNRKATIVIEHLIQASDISHTMQHWHVYRKWNERLFRELYKAYRAGRMDNNPADDWYKGEMGFFDFYIIPLAKKLEDCGVFGKSSDEFLNYAKSNRKEWELKGEGVVADMLADVESEYDTGRSLRRSQRGLHLV